MSFASGFNAFKKWSGSAIAAILDQPNRSAPGLASYTKFRLPTKYNYRRPEFLELDKEATLASADHEIRPVMRPKQCLALDAGYAETINAGKTKKINEDQSYFCTFYLNVPEEFWIDELDTTKYSIPCAYFAIFDGHAGTGAGLMASECLHAHLKEKLTSISHMLILDQEEFTKQHLKHGLILNINSEKLIIGALQETFVEFDEKIKSEKLDYFIDGGCTALVALFILGKLFVANAGDCRAVIYKDFDPIEMSNDHSPDSERQRIQQVAYLRPNLLSDEFTRLQFQHRPRKKDIGTKQLYRDRHMNGWGLKVIDRNDLKPQLISGEGKRSRLLDTIGVTRGFGDHDIEYLYLPGLKIRPFMLPDPEVKVYELSSKEFNENDVLVMGSDGLWEQFKNLDVVEVLKEKFFQQPASEPRRYIVAAQALVDEARGTLGERGWRTRNGNPASYDDISVFVIPLGNHMNLRKYITEEKHVPLHLREDSFVKKYVNRTEVQVHTAKSLSNELNSNQEITLPSQNENGTKTEKDTDASDKDVN